MHRKGPRRVCLAVELCPELLQGGAAFPETARPHYDPKEEDVINILFEEEGNWPHSLCSHTFSYKARKRGGPPSLGP